MPTFCKQIGNNGSLLKLDPLAFWKKGLMKAAKALKIQISQLSHLRSNYAQILQASRQWLRDKTLFTVFYPEMPKKDAKAFKVKEG